MNRRSGGTRGTEDDTTTILGSETSSFPSQAYPTVAIPSSTHITFLSTQTAFASASYSVNEAPLAITSTTTILGASPSAISQEHAESHQNAWNRMGHGPQGGIIGAIVVIFVAIIFFFWFCCGGRAKWKKTLHGELGSGILPLHSAQPTRSMSNGSNEAQVPMAVVDVPPPRYDEVVHSHQQRPASGIPQVREEEESGLVADGKTPLSEIPFEDEILNHRSSENASSQPFSIRHLTAVRGDTSGHTNT